MTVAHGQIQVQKKRDLLRLAAQEKVATSGRGLPYKTDGDARRKF